MNWSSVMWGPFESLFIILNWPIKKFSLSFWSMQIIFASHYLEIRGKIAFNIFCHVSLRWFRIHWLSPFPVILNFRIKEMMISNTIRWSFIDIFELVCILMLTSALIKVLLVLSMIAMIVLTICYTCSIIPCGHVSPSGQICSFVKSIHFIFATFLF